MNDCLLTASTTESLVALSLMNCLLSDSVAYKGYFYAVLELGQSLMSIDFAAC